MSQATTYGVVNYVGDLINVSPLDTPFLSAIGGLSGGGEKTTSVRFPWTTSTVRAGVTNNAALEGADASSSTPRTRSQYDNIVEIHQSVIEVSYSKQAATGQYSGLAVAGSNAVTDELAWQIEQELAAIAIDVEKSFLLGTKQVPTDNTTARKTQGIIGAVTTNLSANGNVNRALTKAIVDNHLKSMFTNGAPLNQATTVFVVSAQKKVDLSNLYATATLNQPTMSRNVGGVAIDTIVTDFGTFGVMVDRYMPDDKILVADLAQCKPVWLEIPGKGLLFVEPLAKTGSAEKFQIYGEVGLKYGPELYHGVIDDLS